MALKRVNAVIVGAGAGGGVVAKELSTAGNYNTDYPLLPTDLPISL